MSAPIIAHILNQPLTSWTVKIATGCDYLGLLRSRVIRSWFGITETRLMDVQREFNSNRKICDAHVGSITVEAWNNNCQRWGIASKINKVVQEKEPFGPDLRHAMHNERLNALKKPFLEGNALKNGLEGFNPRLSPGALHAIPPHKLSPADPRPVPEAPSNPRLQRFNPGVSPDILQAIPPHKLSPLYNPVPGAHKPLPPSPRAVPAHHEHPPQGLHPRTKGMERLLAGAAAHESGFIRIAGKEYRAVNANVHEFTTEPLASVGSSTGREISLLDPDNSPLLQARYTAFESAIEEYRKTKGRPLSPLEIATFTDRFMSQVFRRSSEENVAIFVNECIDDPSIPKIKIKGESVPCIPIDRFLAARIGVCRHHAQVAAYFIERYCKDHPAHCTEELKIQITRDNVKGGAHAWLTIITKSGKNICLDTLNHKVGDLSDNSFTARFDRAFGGDTARRQIDRANQLRRNLGWR